MQGAIVSKAAQAYLELGQKAGLDVSNWLVFDTVSAILDLSAAQLVQINWLLSEPDLVVSLLPHLPGLKWCQSTWAGVEVILGTHHAQGGALVPLALPNYVLTNVRGVFGSLMAEYVLAYCLAHEREVLACHQAQTERLWLNHAGLGVIRGKTMLILGAGSIGAEMARMMAFMGVRVLAVVGTVREIEGASEVGTFAELPCFLPQADYVVNVLPNTDATQNLIDALFLKKMAAHALLINVGRGQAVVDADLIEALQNRTIAGAVLDVCRTEPLPQTHGFWTAPNLVLTFHTAAPSLPDDVFGIFHTNYLRFVAGEKLLHVVDFERGY